MVIDNDVASEFIAVTNDSGEDTPTTILYGTVQKIGSKTYVVIDGSSESVPVDSTVVVSNGDRVTVTIENHTATVTGNLTDKSASSGELADAQTIIDEQGNQITALNTSIELLNSVIEIDDSAVTINGVDIDLLSTTVSTINSEISALNSSIDVINSEISAQNSTIETIQSNVSTIDSKISTLNSSIDVINSEISAQNSTIETIQSNVSTINSEISALNSSIDVVNSEISAQNSTIETIQSNVSTIDSKISTLNSSISVLESSIEIYNSSFQITDGVVTGIKGVDTEWITTNSLEASVAAIESLDADYAQIDFANIGEAAVEKLFSDSGIIGNLVMEDGCVTGTLVGVTIKGDLIEAGTIVADKLVIVGTDGLYYALNTDGTTVTSEQTEYNSLNGGVITAQSVTADKISVSDLVAFDATVGGFNITEDSIYSGVKASVDNTTRGIYLDDDGQICFGDASNFLKYYYDSDEGTWKLAISANSLMFTASDGTTSNISDTIDTLNESTIVGYSFQYAISDSYSDAPTDGWGETADWTEGSYIWQRSVAVYGSGNIEYGEPVCITGNTGAAGADGATISSYTISYQASASATSTPTGTWYSAVQATSTSKPYLWTRTVVNYSDGTSTTSYSVSSTMDSVDIETPVNELWAQFTDTSGNAWINMTSTPSIQIGKSDSYDLVEVTQNDITVGDKSSKYVYIDSDSIDLVDSTETLATFTSDTGITLNQNGKIAATFTRSGVDLYQSGTSVATFGQNSARIGLGTGASATVEDFGLTVRDSDAKTVMTVGAGSNSFDGDSIITSGGNRDLVLMHPIDSIESASLYNTLRFKSPSYTSGYTTASTTFVTIDETYWAYSSRTSLTGTSQVTGVYVGGTLYTGSYQLYVGTPTGYSYSCVGVQFSYGTNFSLNNGTAAVTIRYTVASVASASGTTSFRLGSGGDAGVAAEIYGGYDVSISSSGTATWQTGTEFLQLYSLANTFIESENSIDLYTGGYDAEILMSGDDITISADGGVTVTDDLTGSGMITSSGGFANVGKQLYSGSWSSGTLTVSGLSSHCLFAVYLYGNATPIIVYSGTGRSDFRGVGGYINGTTNIRLYGIYATRSGNTLTYTNAGYATTSGGATSISTGSQAVQYIFSIV